MHVDGPQGPISRTGPGHARPANQEKKEKVISKCKRDVEHKRHRRRATAGRGGAEMGMKKHRPGGRCKSKGARVKA